jgi:hypothetical protein
VTDFILVPSRRPEAVRRLIALPVFARSERFGYLDKEELELSTIVADAFGSFLTDPATSSEDVHAALALLDELAGWNAPDVDGLIQSGVLGALDTAFMVRFRPRFGRHFERLVSRSGWKQLE